MSSSGTGQPFRTIRIETRTDQRTGFLRDIADAAQDNPTADLRLR